MDSGRVVSGTFIILIYRWVYLPSKVSNVILALDARKDIYARIFNAWNLIVCLHEDIHRMACWKGISLPQNKLRDSEILAPRSRSRIYNIASSLDVFHEFQRVVPDHLLVTKTTKVQGILFSHGISTYSHMWSCSYLCTNSFNSRPSGASTSTVPGNK